MIAPVTVIGASKMSVHHRLAIPSSLRAGQRAANVMSLIQSAKLNRQDPYRDLKDVLGSLPTQHASRLEELLPHRWALAKGSSSTTLSVVRR